MKKILFVGATGYGNVGDEAYKIILGDHLKEAHYVHFDSPYPDIKLIKEFDFVIIGGGGLIYSDNTAHFDYMKMYMDEAIRQNKPYAFLSCGVQIHNYKHSDSEIDVINQAANQIKNWKPYLDKALFITVRSELDRKIIESITDNKNTFDFPDLVYLLKPSTYHLIEEGSIVFIPTNDSVKSEQFRFHLDRLKFDSRRKYFISFSPEDNKIVEQYGLKLINKGNFSYRLNLTPNEALSIVYDSDEIISGRFHGLLFAHMAMIEEVKVHNIDNRYKSMNSTYKTNIPEHSCGHLFILSKFINNEQKN